MPAQEHAHGGVESRVRLLGPPAMIAATCSNSPGPVQWPAISELVFSYVLYLGVLTLSVVLYRLSPFHPLSRYPGPVLCRTSMFWHVIRTADGKQMVYLRSLHATYGDIVRIGESPLPSALGGTMCSVRLRHFSPPGPLR